MALVGIVMFALSVFFFNYRFSGFYGIRRKSRRVLFSPVISIA